MAFSWLVLALGHWLARKEDITTKLTTGVAALVVGSLVLTLVGAQKVLGQPCALNSIIGIAVLVGLSHSRLSPAKFWQFCSDNLSLSRARITANFWIGVAVFAIPILPYLFTPSPPDADITAMKELAGFLFQGQYLNHAVPGPIGEYFSIRYPAGVPATAWFLSQLMNMGASESLTIIWLLTWGLLIINIVALTQFFRGTIWIALFFTLNATFTGFYGLTGGQLQEMLAYALGVGMITQILHHRYGLSSIMLAAAMVTHPVVAVPFCLVWGIEALICIFNTMRKHQRYAPADQYLATSVLAAIAYLAWMSTGNAAYESEPQKLLKALTIPDFFRNIMHWLDYDTFHLWFFCGVLIFPWIFASDRKLRPQFVRLWLWFLGANLINGLFGSTVQFHYTATFQAGFSVAALWIVAMAITYQKLSTKIPKAKFLPLCFALLWVLLVLPQMIWEPSSVFITHSDIRVAKFISQKLPNDSLILTVSPYSSLWGNSRSRYTVVRGDTYRNGLYSIISFHQAKSGNFVDRPGLGAFLSPDTPFNQFAASVKSQKVTHILVVARPESRKWVGASSLKPIFENRDTFLFEL